jgi:TrkA-N domain
MSTSKGEDSEFDDEDWGSDKMSFRRRVRVWWLSAQKWVLFVAIAVVVVFGTIGGHQYLAENHQPARLTDSLYMALQCFWVDGPAGGGRTGYPLAYQIARFLGPFVLVYAAVYTAVRVFRRQVDRFTVKWHKDHLVICGFGLQGQALAEAALKKNMKIAIVDQDVDTHQEAVRHLRQRGPAPILIGDARKRETLKAAGVHKAEQIVVLCGTDEANGQIVAAIEKLMESHGPHEPSKLERAIERGLNSHKSHRPSKLRAKIEKWLRKRKSHGRSKLRVMVQVLDIELCERLELNELRFGPRSRSIDIDFECLPDLAAKFILRQFDLPEYPAEWPTVVIAGAGPMAEAMLISVAQKSLPRRFPVPPLVIVADEKADEMVENVLRRHPRIATILDVWRENGQACARHVRKGDELVYICLDDEAQGVALGLALQLGEHRPRRTVVQTWQRHSLLDVTAQDLTGTSSIEHVGILEALEDLDAVLGGGREQLARAIHEHYYAEAGASKDGHKPWDERSKPRNELPPTAASKKARKGRAETLEQRYKDQCRDQAGTFQDKLNEIGACIVPSLLNEDYVEEFRPDEVELLARSEHERWMRWELDDGYWPGPPMADGSRRNKKAKTHADLVEFEKLPPGERKKDFDAIKNMPEVLKGINYGIVRRKERKVSFVDRTAVDSVA